MAEALREGRKRRVARRDINATETVTFLVRGVGGVRSIAAGTQHQSAQAFRVGNGSGVFGMGSPRVLEFGMHLSF